MRTGKGWKNNILWQLWFPHFFAAKSSILELLPFNAVFKTRIRMDPHWFCSPESGSRSALRKTDGSWSGSAKTARIRTTVPKLVTSAIQCCGSMTFWCGSRSGICYIRHWPSGCQQKTNLKKIVFLLIHFSKIKSKKKKSSQSSRNQGVFLLFLLDVTRIRIRIPTSD